MADIIDRASKMESRRMSSEAAQKGIQFPAMVPKLVGEAEGDRWSPLQPAPQGFLGEAPQQ